jgi:hypothetical protein
MWLAFDDLGHDRIRLSIEMAMGQGRGVLKELVDIGFQGLGQHVERARMRPTRCGIQQFLDRP